MKLLCKGAIEMKISNILLKRYSIEHLRSNDPSHLIHRLAPTPLLMTVAANDVLTPTDLALEAYSRAREPKQLHIIPGGHFDGYRYSRLAQISPRTCTNQLSGPNFERNVGTQVAFLRETLCM